MAAEIGPAAAEAARTSPQTHAFRIDADGPRPIGFAEATALVASGGPTAAADATAAPWVWLHLDRAAIEARRWLEEGSGFSKALIEALTSDDTRPRTATLDGGTLVILRGLPRRSDELTDSLVSVRLFVDRRRVLSVRLQPFAPTHAIARLLEARDGPETPSAFVAHLVDITLDQLELRLDRIGRRVDLLEELALAEPTGELRARRSELIAVKRALVVTRRHMRPQQEALTRLAALAQGDADGLDWVQETDRPALRELADQTGRIAEDLEELRERTTLIGEEMQARLTDRMNRTMVRLAAVSTVFLPLTFLTGLVGANLAGIPFAAQSFSFAAFCFGLAGVALLALVLVRRLDQP